MSADEANADKSISDNRLCLHHSLNDQDVSQDNRPIVIPMASKSIHWPFADHKLTLKRSTSVDSVLLADSYQLAGSGQALAAHHYRHRSDHSTQTPHEWEELDKVRSELVVVKGHKYQSTEAKSQETYTDQGISTNRDQSTQIYECDYRDDKFLIPSDISPIKSTKSGPIAIPSKLCVDTSRTANSVEELNQEIESLVLKGIGAIRDHQTLCDKIPEGHRAPVVELLTVTGLTSNRVNSSGGQSGDSDQSQPESPLFIETVSNAETNGIDECSSPKINKFLTREPPDGCEKIKIMTEDDRANMMNGYPHVVRPVQPSSGFVLLPSRSSAFLPILKANDLMADCIHNRINYRKS